MSQFIETICFESGKYQLLPLHQQRMTKTFGVFYPQIRPFKLVDILPVLEGPAKRKVRVTYDRNSFELHEQLYAKKNITSIRVVETSINYQYKFADRRELNALLMEAGTSDILLSSNGILTDASYSNLVFYNGAEWLTPENPLLAGIKREHLLAQGKIREAKIKAVDLKTFDRIGFINALLDIDDLNYRLDDLIIE